MPDSSAIYLIKFVFEEMERLRMVEVPDPVEFAAEVCIVAQGAFTAILI